MSMCILVPAIQMSKCGTGMVDDHNHSLAAANCTEFRTDHTKGQPMDEFESIFGICKGELFAGLGLCG